MRNCVALEEGVSALLVDPGSSVLFNDVSVALSYLVVDSCLPWVSSHTHILEEVCC